LDTIESLESRYGILLKSSFRDRDEILKAAKKIDNLRCKFGSKKGNLTSEKIIRKLRDSR